MRELTFKAKDPTQIRPPFLLAFQAARQFAEPFEILLRPLKAKRSTDQNKRYWALLREVAATVWVDGRQFSDEVWHTYFRQLFIGSDSVVMPDGKEVVTPISTTTLSVDEMGHYMQQIEQWCVEQGFPVMEVT